MEQSPSPQELRAPGKQMVAAAALVCAVPEPCPHRGGTKDSVCVQGCCSKSPQTWRPKATHILSQLRYQCRWAEMKVSGGHAPPEASGRIRSLPPPTSVVPAFLGCGHITPISVSTATWPFPIVWLSNGPLPPSYKDTWDGI